MVSSRWERDWHHYLACSLKYLIVVVDGRGTGFKGRKLRNPVRGHLGQLEVQDQINAAKIWASKRYVDSRRIGIWVSKKKMGRISRLNRVYRDGYVFDHGNSEFL